MSEHAASAKAPRALLIVGAPRSGTTLIGNYLGSHPAVLNLGEFGGFHLSYNIARSTIGAMPGPFREEYLDDLTAHARRFAESLATARGCTWYCDATPWDILIADQLAADLPDAVFVLMLRHFAGTVQSLRRSYAGGFQWAGAGWADSAAVWRSFYESARKLPADRTIPVSYDALASEPYPTLSVFWMRLQEHGFDATALDARQLAVSHAPPIGRGDRPTIGEVRGDDVELKPISSFDPERWSGDIHRLVWPVVADVHNELKRRFEGIYRSPPPSSGLKAHDEVDGLVPLVIDSTW